MTYVVTIVNVSWLSLLLVIWDDRFVSLFVCLFLHVACFRISMYVSIYLVRKYWAHLFYAVVERHYCLHTKHIADTIMQRLTQDLFDIMYSKYWFRPGYHRAVSLACHRSDLLDSVLWVPHDVQSKIQILPSTRKCRLPRDSDPMF